VTVANRSAKQPGADFALSAVGSIVRPLELRAVRGEGAPSVTACELGSPSGHPKHRGQPPRDGTDKIQLASAEAPRPRCDLYSLAPGRSDHIEAGGADRVKDAISDQPVKIEPLAMI